MEEEQETAQNPGTVTTPGPETQMTFQWKNINENKYLDSTTRWSSGCRCREWSNLRSPPSLWDFISRWETETPNKWLHTSTSQSVSLSAMNEKWRAGEIPAEGWSWSLLVREGLPVEKDVWAEICRMQRGVRLQKWTERDLCVRWWQQHMWRRPWKSYGAFKAPRETPRGWNSLPRGQVQFMPGLSKAELGSWNRYEERKVIKGF